MRHALAILILLAAGVTPAAAQLEPGRPIRLVVGYGPGGYRFSDYLRIGLPLNGVVGCVSLGMILWLYF